MWRRGRRGGGGGGDGGGSGFECSLAAWRDLISKQPPKGQLSLSACGEVNDGSTWRETAAAQALTLLPSTAADVSIEQFEKGACLKRSALQSHSEAAYAANEAYMRDVGLTPEHMHECRRDPTIMSLWNKPQQTLFGFIPLPDIESKNKAYQMCAKQYADVNALFQRCNPIDQTILQPQERNWILFETQLQAFSVKAYDGLDWRTKEEMTMVSPAQNFAVLFPTVAASQQLWIKGSQYSIPSLLGNYQTLLSAAASDLVTYIFRLTPRQYHRFHMPVTGKIVGMVFLGTRHLSVQPALLQDPFTNVLTENVRVVLFVQTAYFGTIAIVIVGATCVFSIILSHPILSQALNQAMKFSGKLINTQVLMRKRQQLGMFRYGSTILIILPKSKNLVLSSHLQEASANQIETEIQVGQPVALSTTPLIITPTAASNTLLPTNAIPLSVKDFSLCN